MKSSYYYFLICLSVIFSSCQKGNENTNERDYEINGFVQKGPFIQGSSITIQELDEDFNPTGTVFLTDTSNDFGAFNSEVTLRNNIVFIKASGYYFNEVECNISNSTLSLKAVIDLDSNTDINVNLLTTLIFDRVVYLVKNENMTFANAKLQAENELLSSLHLSQSNNFETLDITDNSLILAVSCIFQGNLPTGEMSELIAHFSSDLKNDGDIDDVTILHKLGINTNYFNVDAVIECLTNRYNSLGINVTIPNFEDVINQFIVFRQRTINVPTDYSTIELAINNSVEGDTIIVHPGIYNETVIISHNIVLASKFIINNDPSFIQNTIIDGNGLGECLVLVLTDSSCEVIGFTIKNASGPGCIVNQNGHLKSLIIENNIQGIKSEGSPEISNCIIRNSIGEGIVCYGDNQLIKIKKTLIYGNNGGALVVVDNHTTTELTNVTISNNFSNQSTLVVNHLTSTLNISNSIIWNNNNNGNLIYVPSSNCLNIYYSNLSFINNGVGNINSNPMFVDSNNNNYNLLSTSPCINAGNPNVVYNDLDGSRNDMGATGGH